MATLTLLDVAPFLPLQEAFAEVKAVVITEHGRPPQRGGGGRRSSLIARLLAAAGYSRQPRSAVVFREYAPRVWQWLRREVYGVSSESYISSMGGTSDGTGDISTGQHQFSEAKGGGFFFFSVDRRHVVTTHTARDPNPKPNPDPKPNPNPTPTPTPNPQPQPGTWSRPWMQWSIARCCRCCPGYAAICRPRATSGGRRARSSPGSRGSTPSECTLARCWPCAGPLLALC